MQALSDRRVSQVTVCAPAQLMKSELCINTAIWGATNGQDVLFWEPDRDLVKKFLRDRIRPAVIGTDDDAIRMSAGAEDLKRLDSSMEIRLGGGGTITGLTPQMKTGKSSHTAPIAVLDEIDKMRDFTMITVAESRTLTYGNDAVILAVSTPTIDAPGTSWRLWHEGSRGRWHGRCRHCGKFVRIDWDVVQFDKDTDGFWLPSTWRMPCDSCGAAWSESDRQIASRGGQYIHADPENPHRTFHIPGPAHLFRDLRWIVDRGARAWKGAMLEGTWEDYKLFVNERCAEVWSDEYEGLSARKMQRATYSLGARGKDDLGELDRRVVLVTAGCDVGDHAIYAEFVAWAIEPKTGQVVCFGLRYRIIGGGPADLLEDPEMWSEFFRMIDESVWRHPAFPGRTFGAQQVFIDCHWRPEVVWPKCEEAYAQEARARKLDIVHPFTARILPCFGKSIERGSHPLDLTDGNRNSPGKRMRYPARVKLNTTMLKGVIYDIQMRDQQQPEGAPKQMIWPTNLEATGYTEAYFREMSNEIRKTRYTTKGEWTVAWEVREERAKMNEAWDCRVYALAAAMMHANPRVGLQEALLKRAISHGTQHPGRWTEEEMADMRRHLDISRRE